MKNEKLSIAELSPGFYFRENNGDWILVLGEGNDFRRFGTISCHAKVKRGQGSKTPDPEGFAIAQRVCDLWNQGGGK